jgi:hypothetical protein
VALVLYHSYNEGTGTATADLSGNGNAGALTGSPGPVWGTGPPQAGTALDYSNGTSYTQVTAAASINNLNSSGLTICCRVKVATDGGTNSGRIFEKGAGGSSLILRTDTGNYSFLGNTNATSATQRRSAAAIDYNNWHHLTFSWDGGLAAANMHCYVDGALSDGTSADGVGSAQPETSNLFIGNRPALDRLLDGLVDDLMIFNTVLSATEIAKIAAGFLPADLFARNNLAPMLAR